MRSRALQWLFDGGVSLNAHPASPTEDEYKAMVLDKTGGLFRLAVRVMQAFSENKTDFIPLVNSLGLFFQIQDDYMNLQSEEYANNKSFCEDLTEGKFSFPIIHAIRTNPTDHRLMNILKQRTTKDAIKMYAVTYMEQAGSFTYTRNVIKVSGRCGDVVLQFTNGMCACAFVCLSVFVSSNCKAKHWR